MVEVRLQGNNKISTFRYLVMSEEVAAMETSHDVDNTIEPLNVMVQPKTITKHHIDYGKRLKKSFMFKVNAIKFLMGAAAIASQVIYDAHYKATGTLFIWYYFGNFYISLAGFFGMITSVKPLFSTLCISTVMSIVSSLVCTPLLIASSIFTARESQKSFYHDTFKLVLFVIQFAIGLIQACVAIASTVMASKAICNCSGNMNKRDKTYRDNNERSNAITRSIENRPIVYTPHQGGCITIPISQIQEAFLYHGGMTSSTGTADFGNVNDGKENAGEQYLPSAPPDYEDVVNERY